MKHARYKSEVKRSALGKWNMRFLTLAEHVATWSKDPTTKVGCVITDPYNTLIATGYNGFPREIEDMPERLNDKVMKRKLMVHAETNAILRALRRPRADVAYLIGDRLYTTKTPCMECAKMIVQTEINEVFALDDIGDDWNKVLDLLDEAGVFVSIVTDG